ncbi:MAG: nucleotidyl transferase AbiEii/AbiGii toxin family protein [Chloroflexi bacterium]|nr:nucleotidyl transferase AbiEii/AbiGii toxin family protein [Chloroflexota bacterium]
MTAISNAMSDRYLTRAQLEIINKRTLRFPLQVAEKDYFLALAVQKIARSSLEKKLVFKGGTAIHHCHLPQYRFSEDLDFTSLDPKITAEEIQSALETDDLFKAQKIFTSDFTIKIERLQYQGLLGQPGNIKVEVDFQQNVVLPAKTVIYENVWGVNASPKVMDKREICAEKVRATAQRARYRDFYDLYFLLHELKIDQIEMMNLLCKKEIRTPITKANMVKNWTIAKEQQLKDMGSIYCRKTVENLLIEKMIDTLEFDKITPA